MAGLAYPLLPDRGQDNRPFYKRFYYDCIRGQRKGEDDDAYQKAFQRQEAYFRELRDQPGVDVVEGVTRGDKRLHQKRIDVAIAVQMLTHSFRHNMRRATLLTGDQDFLFLVEALVQDVLYVTLWFEENSAADELVLAADDQLRISPASIWQFLRRPSESSRPETD